jgi:hypothetical protein
VLDALAGETDALRRGFDPSGRATFDRLLAVRKREAALAVRRAPGQSVADYRAQLQALQREDDTLDQEIANTSASYRKATEPVSLQDIQAALGSRAALIDFVVYHAYDARAGSTMAKQGDLKYGAFIILNTGKPAWVDLGSANTIDKSVFRFQHDLQVRRNN